VRCRVAEAVAHGGEDGGDAAEAWDRGSRISKLLVQLLVTFSAA
jgi:hypothetical protein